MEVLHGAGVFGIEMFVTSDDEILINEIAPRVHNSGHHTLQSCNTSQFEQHLRAILGMDLGDSSIKTPTIMYNILGPKTFQGEYNVLFKKQDNIHLKMYGKLESKPQRKIGHVNVVDVENRGICLLYTSPSPRDLSTSRMPSSACFFTFSETRPGAIVVLKILFS